LRAELNKNLEQIISELRGIAELVIPAEVPRDLIRDVKDNAVLACAVGGNADYIVSGDKDLLVVGSYQEITIINVTLFLQRLIQE